MSNADFYAIKIFWIKNVTELLDLISKKDVLDYCLCNKVINNRYKVIVTLKV